MKKINTLLLVLMIELILGPMFPKSFISVTYAVTAADCAKTEGMRLDTSTNKCVTTTNVDKSKGDMNECLRESLSEKDCFDKHKIRGEELLAEAHDEGELANKKGKNRDIDVNKLNKVHGGPTALAVVVLIYAIVLNKSMLKDCPSSSAKVLLAAGIMVAAAEVATWLTYKIKTDKLKKKYADLVEKHVEGATDEEKRVTAWESQKRAFEYLADNEGAIKTAANVRGGTYAAAAALFATVAVLATIEMIKGYYTGGSDSLCVDKNKNAISSGKGGGGGGKLLKYLPIALGLAGMVVPLIMNKKKSSSMNFDKFRFQKSFRDQIYFSKDYATTMSLSLENDYIESHRVSSPTVADYKNYKDDAFLLNNQNLNSLVKKSFTMKFKMENLLISKAHAAPLSGTVVFRELKMFQKIMIHPITRIVIGGLGTGLCTYTSVKSFQAAGQAKRRQEYLLGLIEDMPEGGGLGGCTAADRQDKENAHCYCYNEDRSKNTQRSNSKICSQHWAQGDFNAGDYNNSLSGAQGSGGGLYNQGANGCVDGRTGAFDQHCKCQSAKNKSGQNACMKTLGGINLGKLGNAGWVNSVGNTSDSLLDGTLSGADISSSDMLGKAAGAMSLRNKLLKDNPKLGAKLRKISSGIKRRATNFSPAALKKFNSNSSSGSAAGSGGLAGLSAPDLASIAEKLPDDYKSKTYNGKATAKGAKSATGGSGDYSWSGSGGSDAGGGVEIKSDADYAYDNKDIYKNSGDSIFKLITNRYQLSAYRRIFDDKKIEEKPAPEKSKK